MIDITTYNFSIRLEFVNFLIDIPDRFLSLPEDTLSREEQEFIKQEVSTYHLENQISLSNFNLPYDTKNPDDIPEYEITDFCFDNDLSDLEYSIEKDTEEQVYSLTAEEPLELAFECKTLAYTDVDIFEFGITDDLDEVLNYTNPCFEYNYDTVLSIEDTNTQSVYPDDLYDSNPTLYQLWNEVNQKNLQDDYNIHTYTKKTVISPNPD